MATTRLNPALVFIGFMGAGKSTAARDVAAAIGVDALDTDELLEREFGTTIADFFERKGEAAFRAREEALVLSLLDSADGGVIALGGGAVESDAVRAALGRHVVVHVEVAESVAWERAAGSGRPLARDRAEFADRHARRGPLYDELADAILPNAGPARAAAPSLAQLAGAPPGTRLLWARSQSGDYAAWIGPGLLAAAPWPPDLRRFCVSDETVAPLYAALIGDLAGLVEIPAGEAHKTLQTAELVWRALAAQGVGRGDCLVALGGGVVGDLAGFCAATYQRGIPVVQVPTTLVGQVDSAYGGKTGVDLPEAKNYVGAYHQPAAVVADTATLATLPPEEHAAGYAEVVKTALIAGGSLWERVAAGAVVDERVVFDCARTKLAVVAADERDGGRRQVLNLGHTVGHALETVTGYSRLRHGEAVALGLLAALRLSGAGDLRDEVAALLAGAGLPTTIDGIDPDAIAEATELDKKRAAGRTPFVLCTKPGEVSHGHEVSRDELLAAVRELAAP